MLFLEKSEIDSENSRMPEMLKRTFYLEELRGFIKHYPVTALIGARQTGKTTLARVIAEL